MKKQIITIVILAVVVLSFGLFLLFKKTGIFTPHAATANPTLTLNPGQKSVTLNSTFNVEIMMNLDGASAAGVQIAYLRYNPNVLQVQDADAGTPGTQITPGALIGSGANQFDVVIANNVDTTLGKISFSAASFTKNISANGVIAIVNFKAIANATNSPATFDFTPGLKTQTMIGEVATGNNILSSVGGGSYSVGQPQSAPTVDLKVDGQNGPITKNSGESATLSWATAHATTCSAFGDWSGNKAISGSESTGSLNASKTYGLNCQNSGGTSMDSVTINIQNPANPGQGSTTTTTGQTPSSNGTTGTTGTTSTPKQSTKLPSNIQPKSTPTQNAITLTKNEAMKPWTLWFLYAIIPAFLAGGAIYLYLRRKKADNRDEME